MAYDSRTDRATATWDKKAERSRRFNSTKTKRRTTKSAQRRAYRDFTEYDA